METQEFNQQQLQSILELMVLGMYVDGHIASSEDVRVKTLVDQTEFENDYGKEQFLDDIFTRVSRTSLTREGLKNYIEGLAPSFNDPSSQSKAKQLVAGLLKSDSNLSEKESEYLALIEESFSN
jgi:hypothetical protein